MSELGQWLFDKQKDAILKSLDLKMSRTGVVQVVTGAAVTVSDPLTGVTEQELLPVLGQMPVVGERVVILPLSDGSRMALRIGADPSTPLDPTNLTFVGPPYGNLGGAHIQAGRALYLTTHLPLGTLAGVSVTADRVYYIPVWIPKALTTNGFVFEITTFVAGSIQLGIYECDTSFLPGARLSLSNKGAQASTGVKTFVSGGVSLPGGRWVFVAICSTSAMAFRGSTTSANLPSLRGGSDQNGSSVYMMASEPLTAGWSNLPANASALSLGNTYLHVGVTV